MTNEIQTPIQVAAPVNNDVDHKRKIHNEISEDIIKEFGGMAFIDQEFGEDLIKAIAKGNIRHLSIKY